MPKSRASRKNGTVHKYGGHKFARSSETAELRAAVGQLASAVQRIAAAHDALVGAIIQKAKDSKAIEVAAEVPKELITP